MKGRVAPLIVLAMVCTVLTNGCTHQLRAMAPDLKRAKQDRSQCQEEFELSKRTLGPTGTNPYFVLEPGFQIILEGKMEKVSLLNPLESECKTYAPGIGLIQDAGLLLTGYGFIGN